MRTRFLVPAALSMALTAGTAHAQIVGGTYINGFPAGTLVPPRSSVTVLPAPPSAFTPGPTIRAFPGYGGGFYGGGFYGGGYPGYGVFVPGYNGTVPGGYIPGGYAGNYVVPGGFYYYNNPAPEYYGGDLPVINPPDEAAAEALPGNPPEVVPPINPGPSASSRTPAERRALREQARRDREEEARITNEYRSLARAGAVVPGVLVSQSNRNSTVRVRYQTNGERKIGRFSKDQVYFTANTRTNGATRVATLASAPGMTQVGDRVMVAMPRPAVSRSSGNTIVISNR